MKMDPHEFDRIARGVFAPVYPVIAAQILDRTGIRKGVCLDIGCGGGYLGDDARTRFESALKAAGIPSYTILQDENIGLWIVIKKGLYGPDQL